MLLIWRISTKFGVDIILSIIDARKDEDYIQFYNVYP
jgi:hypothetical protein